MKKKQGFFSRINFNKPWTETDWEKYFRAQDDYRLSLQNQVRKKPASKIRFIGRDEVEAFEPVIREYGFGGGPEVINQLQGLPFHGDQHPEEDYHPTAEEDPHYWREGAPLASVLIYRDCCRFAICTSHEIDRYLKTRGSAYKKKFSAEFESLKFHANWIAINIAEGHRIGYNDDRIRGNIARSRRALKHADLCMGLLSRVSLRTRSNRLRKELFSFAFQLRNGVLAWIDELQLRTE